MLPRSSINLCSRVWLLFFHLRLFGVTHLFLWFSEKISWKLTSIFLKMVFRLRMKMTENLQLWAELKTWREEEEAWLWNRWCNMTIAELRGCSPQGHPRSCQCDGDWGGPCALEVFSLGMVLCAEPCCLRCSYRLRAASSSPVLLLVIATAPLAVNSSFSFLLVIICNSIWISLCVGINVFIYVPLLLFFVPLAHRFVFSTSRRSNWAVPWLYYHYL